MCLDMVQIRIVSTDGQSSVEVEVEQVTGDEYKAVQSRIASNYGHLKNWEAIADAYQYAVTLCPKANPSDVWQHIVYRTYLQLGGSDQSWKRASGQAFENAFVNIYNPLLAQHGIRLAVLSRSSIVQALREMGILGKVGSSKLDIAAEGFCREGKWVLFGAVHAKVSIAERISDDVPASQAMMGAGYFSCVATLDSKSFPPPHGDGINRGELRRDRNGRSDKRDYFERDGLFHACYSYNTRTPPSDPSTPSGSRIKVLTFTDQQPDDFVQDLVDWWTPQKGELCAKPETEVL